MWYIFLLRLSSNASDDIETASAEVQALKSESKGQTIISKKLKVKTIVFACDAGMGSSAMGATALSKKLKERG